MNGTLERINELLGDRYQFERELGSGALATVYLAEDVKHRRRVAVKVLRPEVGSAVAADRFEREIEIAAALNHPNIVPLFDSGRVAEFQFLVMPHAEGESLAARLEREGQLPIQEAIRIACEVAEALSCAHRHGVIHRDIKPGNILLSGGHALVADFGLAKAVHQAVSPTFTATGIIVGTPAYMSPEQATGRAHVDLRTDLYALGCVLFEMLTGELPFRATTLPALIAQHAVATPPALTLQRPAVSVDLESVVQTALAKIPADRFASAGEFLRALKAAQVTHPPRPGSDDWIPLEVAPRTQRPTTSTGASLPSRRRRLLAGIAGFLAIAALPWVGVRWLRFGEADLNPHRVVVFPLGDRSGGGFDGADLALAIVMALEHAEPLRPLDGWEYLTPAQRANAHLLNLDSARIISARAGARRFIQGGVIRAGDTVSVSLALHDTRGDSVILRESASGPITAASAAHIGLQALRRLLPALLDPGRTIDISPVADRDAAAIALWIQGEREYRLSRFEEALESYRRAVSEDSLLTLAALKGAQAANWASDLTSARRFLARALQNIDALPARHQHLARGLDHYIAGNADSAVDHTRSALVEDPDWSEAWMLLGEIHHHLFPDSVIPGTTDRRAFEQAARLDPDFSPPLIHLVEQALREGNVAAAAEWMSKLALAGANADTRRRLDLMRLCLEDGSQPDWRNLVLASPDIVLGSAKELSVAALQSSCSKSAFRALLDIPEIGSGYRWGALLGLAGLLIAEGRNSEAIVLLDSVSDEWPAARTYFILARLAGAPVQQQARQTRAALASIYGESYNGIGNGTLSLLGSWHAMQGETGRLIAIRDSLHRRATANEDLEAAVFRDAMTARVAVLQGDTAGAIATLSALESRIPRDALAWDLAGALPAERIDLANLLLRTGRFNEAIRAASMIDHAQPVAYLAFIPASLEIRLAAARALRRPEAIRAYGDRLLALGHIHRVEQYP